jgi:tRNA(adenine34) deaminase
MNEPLGDEHYMRMALNEARAAFERDEVPVGAVIVSKGKVIARAHNLSEQLRDFTAHAEMQAFTSASEFLGGKFLNECTLYVTLEPCPMCAGACYNTRIGRIVFGARDPKRGYTLFDDRQDKPPLIHPKSEVTGGVLAEECGELLTEFFRKKRSESSD